jgi:16S rRNA processing protein RimM
MTDFPSRFAPDSTLFLRGTARRILEQGRRKGGLVLRLEAISTPEEAANYSGALLTVLETELADLPEGEYYRFQLLGLKALDQDGVLLGTVTDLLDTGESQVLVVQRDAGRDLLVPLVEDYVTSIDIPSGQVKIDPSLLD